MHELETDASDGMPGSTQVAEPAARELKLVLHHSADPLDPVRPAAEKACRLE
jgi:hypothetical protein